MFSTFITKVKALVVSAKSVYMPLDAEMEACSIANVSVPGWATLMYDGWDAIDKSFFGVSLSFILPGEWINWLVLPVYLYLIQVPGTCSSTVYELVL